MKQFLFACLLMPLLSIAQSHCKNHLPVGAGLTAGYSSRHSAVGEMYIAVKATEHFIIYPMSIKVHSAMSDPTMPVIFEPRLGYKLGSWEAYGGYGYHFAGQDDKPQYNQYKGFKPGAGIIKHFGQTLIVTAAISGNVATIQLGIFSFR